MSSALNQPAARLAWIAPEITDLPALKDLTLLTGPGIPGGDVAGTFSY
ncbi:hypothetical protein [Longimicrobium sp.]